jgi:Sortase domain
VGNGIETHQAQEELARQLATEQRAAGQPAPVREAALGEVYGVIRIPRFGPEWHWMVVQGVRRADLAKGPGHYPNTADPGELGNAAFAGHRSGHGQPFADFDQLRRGELEGAYEAFEPVLDLPADQRINGVARSAQRVYDVLRDCPAHRKDRPFARIPR